MKQVPFVANYETQWNAFETWLDYQTASHHYKKQHRCPDIDVPHVYRQICHHLALARSRLYSPILIERLNHLVLRGHQQLYQQQPYLRDNIIHYFAVDFPALVRQEWRLISLSAVLFFLPFLTVITTLQYYPEMVGTLLDDAMLNQVETMYDPVLHERLGREREADSDVYMFGFYIKNNTGIDFQIFSGGLLFGLGTVFFLVFNGLFLGAVAGHLTHLDYIDSFWGFVVGHSAFELTAMIIAGAAGFKLAQALLAPQQRSRARALLENGQIAIQLLYGAASMTIIAAFIEAFWSSIAWIPVEIKYSVGIILWVVVLGYFSLLGHKPRAITAK